MIPAMEITGSYTFAAPSDRVWELLMNPDVIAACIPGCERFEPDGEDRYRVRLNVALAAITGSYDGTVALSDKIVGNSYRLTGEGQGRAGFVKGAHPSRCGPTPTRPSSTSPRPCRPAAPLHESASG